MLCTKCGQEYEGSQCPRCDGPVILVNNSDYLARRKAYEQKQALKERSASSDRKEESQSGLEQVRKIAARKKEELAKASENRKRVKQRKHKRRKSYRKLKIICAAVIILVVTAAAAFGIYKLATKKNYALYVSYNGKIYDIAGLDSNYVCDEKSAIFASDDKTFYTPEWPEVIDKSRCIESMASDNGKYYVSVTYDESKNHNKFAMYIWNKNECALVSEDDYRKEIMYISDEGLVVYSNSDVINDEGSIAGTILEISSVRDDKKNGLVAQTTHIEYNLNKVYVYSDRNMLVCLTNSGSLYTYNYEKMGKPVAVADAVSQVWPVSDRMTGVYTGEADCLNTLKDVETFLYSTSEGVFYYNCSDASPVKIDNKVDSNADYIYDKEEMIIYKITGTSLKSALIKDKHVSEYIELDSVNSKKNYLFFAGDRQLAYVNGDNVLRMVTDNKVSDIAGNVCAGSLSKVYNKSRAVTYISDGKQYYRENLKSEAVDILAAGSATSTEGTHFYKNRIYSFGEDNILYSNTLKGNNSNKIGYVERLWLGTELK